MTAGETSKDTAWTLLFKEEDGRSYMKSSRGQLDKFLFGDWLKVRAWDDGEWIVQVGDCRLWVQQDARGAVSVEMTRGHYDDEKGQNCWVLRDGAKLRIAVRQEADGVAIETVEPRGVSVAVEQRERTFAEVIDGAAESIDGCEPCSDHSLEGFSFLDEADGVPLVLFGELAGTWTIVTDRKVISNRWSPRRECDLALIEHAKFGDSDEGVLVQSGQCEQEFWSPPGEARRVLLELLICAEHYFQDR